MAGPGRKSIPGQGYAGALYKPWIGLVQKGIRRFIAGNAGCWNKTPHDVFIACSPMWWTSCPLTGIGFAPWNFIGDSAYWTQAGPMWPMRTGMGISWTRSFLDLLRGPKINLRMKCGE